MMKRTMLILIISIVPLFLQCNKTIESSDKQDNTSNTKVISKQMSDSLSTFVIDEIKHCGGFPATVTYNSSLGQIEHTVNNKKSDSSPPWEPKLFLKSRLSFSNDKYYYFYFTEGPSCDPNFLISDSNDGHFDNAVLGVKLLIPGDGYIYISGNADDYFDRHRKFIMENNKISEVPQPVYYVGINSVAKEEIILYSEKELINPSAKIKLGDSVFVILCDMGKTFLLENEYGIVGWSNINVNSYYNHSIKDIYYHGD